MNWIFIILHTLLVEAANVEKKQLLVIMFDGFRWDYFDKFEAGKLKAFERIRKEGVKAKYVIPIFPSLSYPSWTTLSTGLYVEEHGIMGNKFYDKERREEFTLYDDTSTSKSFWWQNAEPIWITALREGLNVSVFRWSMCNVEINNYKLDECTPFDMDRSDSTIDSLNNTLHDSVEKLKNGYDLVMVYWDQIDYDGHEYGPNSDIIKFALLETDNVLQHFLNKLDEEEINDKVNIIIVSDHGMKFVGHNSGVKEVNLLPYLYKLDFASYDHGAMTSIITPNEIQTTKIHEVLQGIEGISAYRSHEIPDYLHYGKSNRVPDILVIAHDNYRIGPLSKMHIKMRGMHGWVANVSEMRPIFLAIGPDFKKGYESPPIHLVDIYQLYPYLLDIPAQPHNGSWENVKNMLNSSSRNLLDMRLLFGLIAIFISVFLTVMAPI